MPHLTENTVSTAIKTILSSHIESLKTQKRIEIRGFGTFTIHIRPPRKAHNPKTGEVLFTPEKCAIHFKPGKKLKEQVNASYGKIVIQDEE